MKRSTFLATSAGVAALASTGRLSMAATVPTYVLVHGAFQNGACWHKVKSALEGGGANVIVGDLPGHALGDTRAPGSVTMDDYVATVSEWIKRAGTKVVLVGHSMGGLVISQTAEAVPNLIDRTVYLSAYLPQNGQSLLAMSQLDKDSQLGKYLTVDQQNGFAHVSDEGMRTAFFNGCSESDIADGLKNNIKQPLRPWLAEMKLSDAAFGSIPRYYIHTKEDHAVSYSYQGEMVAKTAVKQEQTVDAGHASMLSRAHDVAYMIETFAKA